MFEEKERNEVDEILMEYVLNEIRGENADK
jgi:hypothetical protein